MLKATPAQLRALLLVLRHRGYAPAERAEGISRTTLHKGVKGAEQAYGCTFFEPAPFRLTPQGEIALPSLEAIIRQWLELEEKLARADRRRLRIMADELVSTEYLPGVIAAFEQRHPEVQCETDSGPEERMIAELRAGQIRCAIAVDTPAWQGFSRAPLVSLPLVLLAPRVAGITAAGELWARSPVSRRLAYSKYAPMLVDFFDQGLRGLQVAWPKRRPMSSLSAAMKAVPATGDIALGVLHPTLAVPPEITVLPLPHFPPVRISAFWVSRKTREIATLVDVLRGVAEKNGGR